MRSHISRTQSASMPDGMPSEPPLLNGGAGSRRDRDQQGCEPRADVPVRGAPVLLGVMSLASPIGVCARTSRALQTAVQRRRKKRARRITDAQGADEIMCRNDKALCMKPMT